MQKVGGSTEIDSFYQYDEIGAVTNGSDFCVLDIVSCVIH